MAPLQGYTETVLTCKGNFYDPHFRKHLNSFKTQLQNLLIKDKQNIILKKVEPWNSVRVTFNIPNEAALRLKQMAESGDTSLRELGVLAVQIDGNNIVSFKMSDESAASTFSTAKSQLTTSIPSVSKSSVKKVKEQPHSNVEMTRKNIVNYLSQQGNTEKGLANHFASLNQQPVSMSEAVHNNIRNSSTEVKPISSSFTEHVSRVSQVSSQLSVPVTMCHPSSPIPSSGAVATFALNNHLSHKPIPPTVSKIITSPSSTQEAISISSTHGLPSSPFILPQKLVSLNNSVPIQATLGLANTVNSQSLFSSCNQNQISAQLDHNLLKTVPPKSCFSNSVTNSSCVSNMSSTHAASSSLLSVENAATSNSLIPSIKYSTQVTSSRENLNVESANVSNCSSFVSNFTSNQHQGILSSTQLPVIPSNAHLTTHSNLLSNHESPSSVKPFSVNSPSVNPSLPNCPQVNATISNLANTTATGTINTTTSPLLVGLLQKNMLSSSHSANIPVSISEGGKRKRRNSDVEIKDKLMVRASSAGHLKISPDLLPNIDHCSLASDIVVQNISTNLVSINSSDQSSSIHATDQEPISYPRKDQKPVESSVSSSLLDTGMSLVCSSACNTDGTASAGVNCRIHSVSSPVIKLSDADSLSSSTSLNFTPSSVLDNSTSHHRSVSFISDANTSIKCNSPPLNSSLSFTSTSNSPVTSKNYSLCHSSNHLVSNSSSFLHTHSLAPLTEKGALQTDSASASSPIHIKGLTQTSVDLDSLTSTHSVSTSYITLPPSVPSTRLSTPPVVNTELHLSSAFCTLKSPPSLSCLVSDLISAASTNPKTTVKCSTSDKHSNFVHSSVQASLTSSVPSNNVSPSLKANSLEISPVFLVDQKTTLSTLSQNLTSSASCANKTLLPSHISALITTSGSLTVRQSFINSCAKGVDVSESFSISLPASGHNTQSVKKRTSPHIASSLSTSSVVLISSSSNDPSIASANTHCNQYPIADSASPPSQSTLCESASTASDSKPHKNIDISFYNVTVTTNLIKNCDSGSTLALSSSITTSFSSVSSLGLSDILISSSSSVTMTAPGISSSHLTTITSLEQNSHSNIIGASNLNNHLFSAHLQSASDRSRAAANQGTCLSDSRVAELLSSFSSVTPRLSVGVKSSDKCPSPTSDRCLAETSFTVPVTVVSSLTSSVQQSTASSCSLDTGPSTASKVTVLSSAANTNKTADTGLSLQSLADSPCSTVCEQRTVLSPECSARCSPAGCNSTKPEVAQSSVECVGVSLSSHTDSTLLKTEAAGSTKSLENSVEFNPMPLTCNVTSIPSLSSLKPDEQSYTGSDNEKISILNSSHSNVIVSKESKAVSPVHQTMISFTSGSSSHSLFTSLSTSLRSEKIEHPKNTTQKTSCDESIFNDHDVPLLSVVSPTTSSSTLIVSISKSISATLSHNNSEDSVARATNLSEKNLSITNQSSCTVTSEKQVFVNNCSPSQNSPSSTPCVFSTVPGLTLSIPMSCINGVTLMVPAGSLTSPTFPNKLTESVKNVIHTVSCESSFPAVSTASESGLFKEHTPSDQTAVNLSEEHSPNCRKISNASPAQCLVTESLDDISLKSMEEDVKSCGVELEIEVNSSPSVNPENGPTEHSISPKDESPSPSFPSTSSSLSQQIISLHCSPSSNVEAEHSYVKPSPKKEVSGSVVNIRTHMVNHVNSLAVPPPVLKVIDQRSLDSVAPNKLNMVSVTQSIEIVKDNSLTVSSELPQKTRDSLSDTLVKEDGAQMLNDTSRTPVKVTSIHKLNMLHKFNTVVPLTDCPVTNSPSQNTCDGLPSQSSQAKDLQPTLKNNDHNTCSPNLENDTHRSANNLKNHSLETDFHDIPAKRPRIHSEPTSYSDEASNNNLNKVSVTVNAVTALDKCLFDGAVTATEAKDLKLLNHQYESIGSHYSNSIYTDKKLVKDERNLAVNNKRARLKHLSLSLEESKSVELQADIAVSKDLQYKRATRSSKTHDHIELTSHLSKKRKR